MRILIVVFIDRLYIDACDRNAFLMCSYENVQLIFILISGDVAKPGSKPYGKTAKAGLIVSQIHAGNDGINGL